MQQHGSKYFACRPSPRPRPWRVGSKGQNPTFSEYCHVERRIQQHGRSYFHLMIPHPTMGVGSKGQNSTLAEHGHVHIKLIGIMNAATWQQIFCPNRPPPLPWGVGSNGQNSTFSEYGHVAYQTKRKSVMQQHSSKYFAQTYPTSFDPTPPPPLTSPQHWGWG